MKAQSIGVMSPGILEKVILILYPVALSSFRRDSAMRRVMENMVIVLAEASMILKGIAHQKKNPMFPTKMYTREGTY